MHNQKEHITMLWGEGCGAEYCIWKLAGGAALTVAATGR